MVYPHYILKNCSIITFIFGPGVPNITSLLCLRNPRVSAGDVVLGMLLTGVRVGVARVMEHLVILEVVCRKTIPNSYVIMLLCFFDTLWLCDLCVLIFNG